MTIRFTDEQGNEWTLGWSTPMPVPSGLRRVRDATPDDLARAGYTPSAENAEVQRLCLEAAKRTRELEALRALEQHVRGQVVSGLWFLELESLIKAVDEARE